MAEEGISAVCTPGRGGGTHAGASGRRKIWGQSGKGRPLGMSGQTIMLTNTASVSQGRPLGMSGQTIRYVRADHKVCQGRPLGMSGKTIRYVREDH